MEAKGIDVVTPYGLETAVLGSPGRGTRADWPTSCGAN